VKLELKGCGRDSENFMPQEDAEYADWRDNFKYSKWLNCCEVINLRKIIFTNIVCSLFFV
jgi:hypothetical protein